MAATRASQYLAANHQNLQKSLDRLSSGKRITQASDDAGGLAVSMKLEHSINGLKGAASNISNAISFLQVQDGILSSAADIVSRIGELKSMYDDVTKNTSDKNTYDAEVDGLQDQLATLSSASKFNGKELFGDDSTLAVVIDAAGTTVAIGQHDLDGSTNTASKNQNLKILATDQTNLAAGLTSTQISDALSEIASYRATNGGQVKRLQYAQADIENQVTNLTAANGRIMDVDIATESATLARHQILVQASAAMVAQANSANNVALQLLQ